MQADDVSDQRIHLAAHLMVSASYATALTGAGLSTPSGVPDFRSPGSGLWQLIDPLAMASIRAFHEQPQAFYRWFLPLARKLRVARPNPAHYALADLEHDGYLRLLITQNIDALHQQAGSEHVIELHGHLRSATCLECEHQEPTTQLWPTIEQGEVPRCERCGGLLKPDVVLFGEPLNYEHLKAAQQAALRCDVMLAAGTSLEVEPAADLPYLAHRRGAQLIIINRQPTLADSIAEVVIRGDVAEILPRLAEACRRHDRPQRS